jgi:hypothetical protein
MIGMAGYRRSHGQSERSLRKRLLGPLEYGSR